MKILFYIEDFHGIPYLQRVEEVGNNDFEVFYDLMSDFFYNPITQSEAETVVRYYPTMKPRLFNEDDDGDYWCGKISYFNLFQKVHTVEGVSGQHNKYQIHWM